jgi:hypothetical protein
VCSARHGAAIITAATPSKRLSSLNTNAFQIQDKISSEKEAIFGISNVRNQPENRGFLVKIESY